MDAGMNRSRIWNIEPTDGFVRYLAAILLSVAVLLPGRAENCPPDAVSTGLYLSIAAYRTDGSLIGPRYVRVGETICFTSAVVFVPFNSVDYSRHAAFSGGSMTIAAADVTPLGGVPLVGFEECGGTNLAVSRRFERPVTLADALAGSIYVTARYSNGMSRAAATVRVPVYPWVSRGPQPPKPPSPHRSAKPQRPKSERWARWSR